MDRDVVTSREDARARLEIAVLWDLPGEQGTAKAQLAAAEPSAQELAQLLLGIEHAYRELAIALGYPPHFVKVTAIRNPELKLELSGGKEVIEALKDLLFALPRWIGSLFHWRVVGELGKLELDKERAKLEADVAAAQAATQEAELKKAKLALELAVLRQQIATVPVAPDLASHALLDELVEKLRAAAPEKRAAFVGDAASYVATKREYAPSSRIAVVPVASGSAPAMSKATH